MSKFLKAFYSRTGLYPDSISKTKIQKRMLCKKNLINDFRMRNNIDLHNNSHMLKRMDRFHGETLLFS